MKRVLYLLAICSLTLAACGAKPAIATVAPLPTIDPVDRQTRVLEALYTAVHDQYIDANFDGVNLDALHTQYQAKVKSGLSNTDFEKAMADLVNNFPKGNVVYQTRSDRITQELQNTSLYSGIGAYISVRTEPEPHIVIMSIIQDSPAQQAGLKAHDSIYTVDGQAVTAAEGLDVIQRVRGEAGTTVTLADACPCGFRQTVKGTRAKFAATDNLQAGVLQNSTIVYLRLPVTPDSNTLNQVGSVMQTIESRGGIKGLILDLRVARSGADWPLSGLLTLFGNGDLGEFYSRKDTTPVTVKGVDVGGSQTLPLALLVGPDTQGQSEIFAAALQSSHRATVIGLPTTGQIFGYSTLPLPDGSQLTFAVSSYKTQAGNDLGNTGVKPDVAINDDWDQVAEDNDPLIIKALDVIASK